MGQLPVAVACTECLRAVRPGTVFDGSKCRSSKTANSYLIATCCASTALLRDWFNGAGSRAPRSIGSAPRAAFTALRVAQVLIPFLVALGGQPELAFSFDVDVDVLLLLTPQ